MSRFRTRLAFWGIAIGIIGVLLLGRTHAHRIVAWLSPLPTTADRKDGEIWEEVEESLDRTESQRTPSTLSRNEGRQTVMPESVGPGWTTLLGPTHDARSPEKGLELIWPKAGPIEKWRAAVGLGYASPVVQDGALVVLHRQDDREVLECFDPESGASQWRFSWPATYDCPYAYSSGPYSAPVLDGGAVYAVGADGDLFCVRLADGSQVWHRNLHKDYHAKVDGWPVSASPLVVGEKLLVNTGARAAQAGIVALEKTTGKTLWTATSDGASCSTPRAAVIRNKQYVFVWTADALVSLDPGDGRVYWRIPFAANHPETAHGTSPLVAGDIVLVSGYQLGNLCLRILPDGSYQELWRNKRDLLDSQYNTLLHIDGLIWGFSATRRRLRCLELTTGEMQHEWRSSKFPMASTIAVDGCYLLFSEKGHLATLTLSDRGIEVQAMTDERLLAPPCLSYPALHRGLLYLRDEEQVLCLDLRREAKPNGKQ